MRSLLLPSLACRLWRDVDLTGWFATNYLDAALKEPKLVGYWTPYGAGGNPVGADAVFDVEAAGLPAPI